MRSTGLNKKQNDLQNVDQSHISYVHPTNGLIATSREMTIDEKIERLISRKQNKYNFTKSNTTVVVTKFNNRRNDMVSKLFCVNQKDKNRILNCLI